MADEAARGEDRRWKWALVALCVLSLALTLSQFFGAVGSSGRPWFGWWDATTAHTGPYVVSIVQPLRGGASDAAGLRDGDRIDLRRQSLEARVSLMYQPPANRTLMLHAVRGTSAHDLPFQGSTVWEGVSLFKIPPLVATSASSFWFCLCALLIALYRWRSRDARALALVLLLATAANGLSPNALVVPGGVARLFCLLLWGLCGAASAALLVRLSSRFGVRTPWRRTLEWFAYGAILANLAVDAFAAGALLTLWIDPIPFTRIGSLSGALGSVATCAITVTVWAAVAKTEPAQRPRTAWLLLPLPLAFLAADALMTLATFVPSWFANTAVIALSQFCFLVGALAVTYALLGRRVLDFEFVLSRTLVVGIVSLIVVTSFILLEWLLGTVLANASHATGLIAAGALTLALGLSLNYIHRRVDEFIEGLLFRKRRDDERALRDFAQEVAYVTDPAALLDRTIDNLKNHTDARGAALLIESTGTYAAVRRYGDVIENAGENDAAILALKTWHKPVDPHQYATVLKGALALPIFARGHLHGIVLLGERAGGEAYAPDEVEALALFAQGVGSAFNALSGAAAGSTQALAESMAALTNEIVALRETLAADRANGAPGSTA